MRRVSHKPRPAFTLVELMMVIAIIGILVGILVPTLYYALTSFKKKAFIFEVQTLANAVDQYKNKFNDYPPDGSDAGIFARHCRKVFPQIAATELTVVSAGSTCNSRGALGVMDPSEALVFFLGGFSKDPAHPFTGPGGPFATAPSGATAPYQYNTDRNEPFYEFPQTQLSLVVFNDSGYDITISDDDSKFGLTTPSGFPGDVIPVFHAKNKVAPYVYFDSRTYSLGGAFFNRYDLSGASHGIARPYKASNGGSFITDTKVSVAFPATAPAAIALADLFYKYANDKTYQIISAGLDDDFGGLAQSGTAPVMFAYPNGESLDIRVAPNAQSSSSRYKDRNDGLQSAQLDNAGNFADSLLEDGLSN